MNVSTTTFSCFSFPALPLPLSLSPSLQFPPISVLLLSQLTVNVVHNLMILSFRLYHDNARADN